jgi:ribosomal-protein-alanine N-acetyltransferase
VEIGYLLNKNYWNQVKMTECLQMVIDYIRSKSSSVKIICMCDVKNLASNRVVEKCGMKYSHYYENDNIEFAVYEV